MALSGPRRWGVVPALAMVSMIAAACGTTAVSDTTDSSPATSSAPTQPSTTSQPSPATSPASDIVPQQPVGGVMSASSEWRRDISGAPLSADSADIVHRLATQVADRYGGVAAFNVNQYNVAFYQVPDDIPGIDVHFDDCQSKGSVPPELSDPALNEPFIDVPLPRSVSAAVGTDGELTIWQPSTDRLWEFWKAHRAEDGWHACWGGRIDNVSNSAGYFPGSTGVSASGLAAAPGSVSIADIEQGHIDHALSLGVVDAAHWSEFSYPARRSDGNLPIGTPGAVEEGQRLRLDPSLDVDALGLSPIAAAIAKAAQRFGFIVVDRAGAVGVAAESGSGLAAAGQGNPWPKLMWGQPSYEVMKGFPWDRLQALPVDYGKPSA